MAEGWALHLKSDVIAPYSAGIEPREMNETKTTGERMMHKLNVALARQYLGEAAALFANDAGRLWGISLDGPMSLLGDGWKL